MKASVVLCPSSPCLQTEIIFTFWKRKGSSLHEIAYFAIANIFFP